MKATRGSEGFVERATHTAIEVFDTAGERIDCMIIDLIHGFKPGDTYRAKIALRGKYPKHEIATRSYAEA